MSIETLANLGQIVAGIASLLAVATIFLVWQQVKLQARHSRTELITGMTTMMIPRPDIYPSCLALYFVGIYSNGPVLREYLDSHSYWYGPQLRQQLGLIRADGS